MEGLKVGDRVTYCPDHLKKKDWQFGVIKEVTKAPRFAEKYVYVVFNCDGNWRNYRHYTGVRTPVEDLVKGWVRSKKKRVLTAGPDAWWDRPKKNEK